VLRGSSSESDKVAGLSVLRWGAGLASLMGDGDGALWRRVGGAVAAAAVAVAVAVGIRRCPAAAGQAVRLEFGRLPPAGSALDDGGIRSGGVDDGDRRDLDIGFRRGPGSGVQLLDALDLFALFLSFPRMCESRCEHVTGNSPAAVVRITRS